MKTDRLYLRERTEELFEETLKQPPDQQLEFFGHPSIELLEVEVDKTKKRHANNESQFIKWDIVDIATQEVVGHCGYHNWLVEHERAELGYFLHERFRGNGYMLEALKKVIQYGFNEMTLNRIQAFISPHNQPSINSVMRLGFTLEGTLKEHYKFQGRIHDSLAYALLRSRYLKQ